VPFVFKLPFRKESVPVKVRFAFKLTEAPTPLIVIETHVPVELGRKSKLAPAVIFTVDVIVAKAENVKVAAELTFNWDIVTLLTKFNIAGWVTPMLAVVHAAVFDQVPVPAKNTGPKVLPPELMVLVPVPMK
jgi:hypothetical protein